MDSTDEAAIPLLTMASNMPTDHKAPRLSSDSARQSHVSAADNNNGNINNIDEGEEGSDLSLYDRKCILVNREIDAMGMGRYQWYIWGLCGFGYMLDLLWAQAFGLVLSPLQQEMGFGDGESGNISTSFNAGLTAGAFVWGLLSDIIGMLFFFFFFLVPERSKETRADISSLQDEDGPST